MTTTEEAAGPAPLAVGTVPNVAADQPIASSWGNIVADDVNLLLRPPSCRVYSTAGQTANHNADLIMVFNAEGYDTDTIHDPAVPTRLTCKTAGKYWIWGHAHWIGNVTGFRIFRLRLNGGTLIAESVRSQVSASNAEGFGVETEYQLAVNDYVEMIGFQTSGVPLGVPNSGVYTPVFGMRWVGL